MFILNQAAVCLSSRFAACRWRRDVQGWIQNESFCLLDRNVKWSTHPEKRACSFTSVSSILMFTYFTCCNKVQALNLHISLGSLTSQTCSDVQCSMLSEKHGLFRDRCWEQRAWRCSNTTFTSFDGRISSYLVNNWNPTSEAGCSRPACSAGSKWSWLCTDCNVIGERTAPQWHYTQLIFIAFI